MSAAAAVSVVPGAVTSEAHVRGVVRVRGRAVEKAVLAASAAAIGVPRRDVHVEVTERGPGLAVRVAAKLPIPDLDDQDAVEAEPSVLERMRETQDTMAEELGRVTGRPISRVSIVVTGATVSTRRRVR